MRKAFGILLLACYVAVVIPLAKHLDRRPVAVKLGYTPDARVLKLTGGEYRQALAERDQAALRLKKTRVYAPMDAVVGPLPVRPGDYVAAGRSLFALVSVHHYVEAHMKETDLEKVRPGQSARIEIDTYPGHVWTAKVSSISPATGSEFSLLPAQNSSGNWVKVVQRVTVRLDLQEPAGAPPLRSGMSAEVRIYTSHPEAWSVAETQPVH